MIAWRLCEVVDPKRAFNGEGARLYGGRWNFKGTSMVYTSASPSLAMLEILVHVEPMLLKRDLFRFRLELPDRGIETLDTGELPAGWREHPPVNRTRALGSEWVKSRRSLGLAVPSALVPEERNILLNPAHPAFAKLVIGKPERVVLDQRLR